MVENSISIRHYNMAKWSQRYSNTWGHSIFKGIEINCIDNNATEQKQLFYHDLSKHIEHDAGKTIRIFKTKGNA